MAPRVHARSTTSPLRCATCHADLDGGEAWTCGGCATTLHRDCADALDRCVTPGCGERWAAPVKAQEQAPPALRRRDRVLVVLVGVVPGLVAFLWPLVAFVVYLLLEATLFPAPPGRFLWRISEDAVTGALLGAALLPLALGNGVLAPLARAGGLPGWHQARALLGALAGGAASGAALWLIASCA